MKELVTAFCAVAVALSTATAAEVVSQNVVGYQEVNGTATKNFVISTLIPVGSDGTTMKLGDIKANSHFVFAGDDIIIFDGFTKVARAYYLDATTAGKNNMDEGWYDADKADDGDYVCINSMLLPYGSGFIFNRSNEKAALVFSGEVNLAPTEIIGGSSKNYVGNCTPVDIKLGEIKVNSKFQFAGDDIIVFDGFTKVARAYYLDATTAGKNDMDEGWYDADKADDGDYVCINNTVVAKAGDGFLFNRANDGAAVILPTPVNE